MKNIKLKDLLSEGFPSHEEVVRILNNKVINDFNKNQKDFDKARNEIEQIFKKYKYRMYERDSMTKNRIKELWSNNTGGRIRLRISYESKGKIYFKLEIPKWPNER